MQLIFAGVLIAGGAILIGLAYHDQVVQAWQILRSPS